MTGNDFPMRGQAPAWLASLDAASQAEWRSIARERDPELYQESLLYFAGRQERRNQEAVAGAIYTSMLEAGDGLNASVLARASDRLAVLNGGGSGGARVERFVRHATQEITDPTMIVALGAAGAVFRMTRLAALARLGAGAPGALTRGWAARGLASSAGFFLEAPTFTMAHRLSAEALGRSQDWSAPALARDFASSYLVLGALKFGGAGAGALQRVGGYRSPVANMIFQQTGMLGGVVIAQGIERRLGWRPAVSSDIAVADALMMWAQFNVAGRLAQGALGPRFRAWESRVDARIAALEQGASNPAREIGGGFGGFGPELAPAGPRFNTRLPAAGPEVALPTHAMMSSSKFGKGGLSGPSRGGSSEPVNEGTTQPRPDPREAFFRVEVPRRIRSRREDETYQYRLVLEDLNLYLSEGADRVIATRDGGEIRLRLIDRDVTREDSQFLPSGLQGYTFEIAEGNTTGQWHIYVMKDGLMSFNLITEQMRPGVGGIILDWLATQAAATERQSQFVAIHNVSVFDIIQRRGLIDEPSAIVEAHPWGPRHRRQSTPLGRFGDVDFRWRNRGGYFNVWAHPRRSLLPPELSSVTITRDLGTSDEHPYELNIEPFRNFLIPGHEAVIARREGQEMKVRVEESVLVGSDNRFMPAGTPLISLSVREGPAEGGKIQLYAEPHRFTLANIERGGLPSGAGTIFLDWIYAQAGARGAAMDLINIRNPKIWRILQRHELFNQDSAQVELGHWDWISGDFQPLTSGSYEPLTILGHYHPSPTLLIPVTHLRSRPNLDRLPAALRRERAD